VVHVYVLDFEDLAAEFAHQIGDSTASNRLDLAGCGHGSENIAQSWSRETIGTQNGGRIGTHSEEDLAKALVTSWMNSPNHRENPLNSDRRHTAVTVKIRDDDKVYAPQKFCA